MSTKLFLAISLAISVQACAPTLKHDISMPKIPDIGAGQRNSVAGAELLVNPFIDARPKATMVYHKGREYKARGDAAGAVETKVRNKLEKEGFRFSSRAPLALSGELRKWEAKVSVGFPAQVDSMAAVYVEVRDPANKRIYAGEYSGNASKQHPNLDAEDINETLGTAMQQALNQLFADAQLLDILQSF